MQVTDQIRHKHVQYIPILCASHCCLECMKLSRQQLSLHWSLCAACWKMASNTAESIRIPEAPMMSLHKSLHSHKRRHKGSAATLTRQELQTT